MYLAVRELTDSSILAVVSAGCFCMLPLYPVYGLSQMGIPLVLYAFLCLNRKKHRTVAFFLTLFFGLTSHLVYTGYAVLGFWVIAIFILLLQKKNVKWETLGFFMLLCTYLLTNSRLFMEFLFGQGSYVSHREEMVGGAMPFWDTVRGVFFESAQHAPAYQTKLIIPIAVLLFMGGICCHKMSQEVKNKFFRAAGVFAVLFLIALFYGFYSFAPVVAWRNSISGFLSYFQMDRFYWLYPAGWYLEVAFVFDVWWTWGRELRSQKAGGIKEMLGGNLLLQCMVLAAVVCPAADIILNNSYFYMNVNQYNNGSDITGYISWESFYSEDLMQELEEAIGRDMGSYRVAHLGVNTAPALMHGFYTVDGYSNNYPLEYKHAFRQVIAAELEKAPDTKVYFDTWGNRCYLFNSVTGNYYMIKKNSGIQYAGLEFDMEALADLGCEYLFSGAEIMDAERMGLEFMGYFETDTSYWGIWLYALDTTE